MVDFILFVKDSLYNFIKFFKYFVRQRRWKKNNRHNFSNISSLTDINKVEVGNYTYGLINAIHSYGSPNEYLKIGSFCSISTDVYFVLGGEHDYKYFSTYPFKVFFENKKIDSFSKGNIVLEDDVWIGHGAIILSGVTISKGSIVGAGSVVTKSTPPYSIVAGNPAKVIKFRFEKSKIDYLLSFDLSKLTKENFKFYKEKLELK